MNNEHPTARENLRPVTATLPEGYKNPGILRGVLHGFFQMVENSECAYPIGIIETEDGKIHDIPTDLIQFTDRPS